MDQDPEILSALSAFPDDAARGARAAAAARTAASSMSVFDACQLGVVLRAVLFVEAVLGVAAMFSAADGADWLSHWALWTAGALPATLLWLIGGCSFKRMLARRPRPVQYAFGIGLGAFCGAYACAMLALLDLENRPP